MLFIDTGPLLARYIERDQWHGEALRGWAQLSVERLRLFTSNFVIDEAATLLARRAGHEFAGRRVRSWYTSRELNVLRPDAADELRALDLFDKFGDQAVSFTDCVSFALMQRQGVDTVFTFDRHFERAGFARWPTGTVSW